jgi:DNA-binding MarR family transcriptional regulator
VSFKQLAHITSSTPGAITQLVSPLVDAGYITRTPDAKDRRIMYVSLTDKGKHFMRRLQASHEEILLSMMEEWTDEEIRIWVDIQDKMLHFLETHQEKEKQNGEN